MDNVELYKILITPLVGAAIGYFTNWLAIRMLFRPYKKYSIDIPFLKVTIDIPFTPGIFPKEQQRFANKVAETITLQLLTAQDIKNLTIRLVTTENIHMAVRKIIDAVIKEFQNIYKLRKLAEEIGNVISVFLKENAPEIIIDTTLKSPLVRDILSKAFDSIILDLKIPLKTSTLMVSTFFDNVATPDAIRKSIINFLTKANIENTSKLIHKHSPGSLYLVLKLINIKTILENFKSYLVKNPDNSNKIISETIESFEIKAKVAEYIANMSFTSLPYSTVSSLRELFIGLIIDYILENSKQMSDNLSSSEITKILTDKILRFDLANDQSESLNNFKKDLAGFISKYLEIELGVLIEEMIPFLGIEKIISEKVLKFTPKQLEQVIIDICKKELQGIEILGGILGLLIGLFQVFILYFSDIV